MERTQQFDVCTARVTVAVKTTRASVTAKVVCGQPFGENVKLRRDTSVTTEVRREREQRCTCCAQDWARKDGVSHKKFLQD